MAKVSVYNMEGKAVGEIELKDEIFGVAVNEHLLHMSVVQQLANKRQGTQKAKTRGESGAAARSPGDRKAPAMPVRDPSGLPSGKAAA